jgi:hypothetical protein
MRLVTIVLALLGTLAAGCDVPHKEQPPTIWLEVGVDRYELDGVPYSSKAELVTALRAIKNPRSIAIHWVVFAKDSANEKAVMAKVEEAQSAAREAGLPPLVGIGNKVFDK